MLLTDAVMVLGDREKPRAVKGTIVPAMGPESRALQPRICDRLICADIPEGEPDFDIVVSKGFVSNDSAGGEGSGLGDVGNNVFADDDVVKEGDIVIKQFHPARNVRG